MVSYARDFTPYIYALTLTLSQRERELCLGGDFLR